MLPSPIDFDDADQLPERTLVGSARLVPGGTATIILGAPGPPGIQPLRGWVSCDDDGTRVGLLSLEYACIETHVRIPVGLVGALVRGLPRSIIYPMELSITVGQLPGLDGHRAGLVQFTLEYRPMGMGS